jgi:DNA-binding MarR family transcriptional regulator
MGDAGLPRTTGAVLAEMNTFCEVFAEFSGDSTMGMQQLKLLLSLAVHGALNQNDLEAHTGVKKSSNGRNIDRLGPGSARETGLGLVESTVDPMDRRYKIVRLTAMGDALLKKCADEVARRHRR